MTIKTLTQNNFDIAVVNSDEVIITDVQSAMDFVLDIKYQTNCTNIVLNKEAICDKFYILSSLLAGEIFQKFVNYQIRFAIYGDFSHYTSKPLKDFMYESNLGDNFYFQPDEQNAIQKLAKL